MTYPLIIVCRIEQGTIFLSTVTVQWRQWLRTDER